MKPSACCPQTCVSGRRKQRISYPFHSPPKPADRSAYIDIKPIPDARLWANATILSYGRVDLVAVIRDIFMASQLRPFVYLNFYYCPNLEDEPMAMWTV